MADRVQLVRGTLDAVVLRALTWRPMHGFEIIRWLEQQSGNALEIEDGTLYHALVRLEKSRCITASWRVTENSRRARYYTLTAKGRAHLRDETAALTAYTRVLNRLLAAEPAE
jgi:PadR family transcriptional regulator PadR